MSILSQSNGNKKRVTHDIVSLLVYHSIHSFISALVYISGLLLSTGKRMLETYIHTNKLTHHTPFTKILL